MCSARASLLEAAGVDTAGGAMLGWARSVTTSWAGPRMASTNQKARKMIDRWEVGVLGFLRPSITTGGEAQDSHGFAVMVKLTKMWKNKSVITITKLRLIKALV